MNRGPSLLIAVTLLLVGCIQPADEPEDEEPSPTHRRSLPTFSPRADTPQVGRIPPTTTAGTAPPDPDPTTASPTATTTSPTTSGPGPSPTTSSPQPTPAPTASPTPSPSPDANGTFAQNIRTLATDASADPGFAIDIQAQGSSRVGAVTIGRSFGTVEFENQTHNVYVHERIPWPEFEYTIYQGLAVREDSWLILWFYCQNETLQWVYYETTHGLNLTFEVALGTCSEASRGSVQVVLPATNMTRPQTVQNFTITGADIRYGNGTGWMVSGERNWSLFPFQVVDCTSECGGSGWHELHVVLWNETGARAAFGILYLRTDRTGEVTLLYGLRLPTLVRMSHTFEAQWTQ